MSRKLSQHDPGLIGLSMLRYIGGDDVMDGVTNVNFFSRRQLS